MTRCLVLGDERFRAVVAGRLSEAAKTEVVECDPALGDCVMYTRLEGARYDSFVFLGWDHPVTRGALAIVAERAVLLPLWDTGDRAFDQAHDGYLFRLPRALGFRDEQERSAVLDAIPGAEEVPAEIVGRDDFDVASLSRLVAQIPLGVWQWADLVDRVAAELEAERPSARRFSRPNRDLP